MGEGGRGAKSYDREKAWSSINNSILSGLNVGQCSKIPLCAEQCSITKTIRD
jgi:hypothetical protein